MDYFLDRIEAAFASITAIWPVLRTFLESLGTF